MAKTSRGLKTLLSHARIEKIWAKRALSTQNPRPITQSSLTFSNDLFIYTRGRFVCDEKYQVSQHHVHFNVNELARIAAEAVGAKICVSIEKYPDGKYNKAMLLTMDDGSQVVAKVPNPNAGLPHFTTASEVATMDFVRNELEIPVPKVLAWSSKAQENPVGAEYIIMEKVQGVELEHVWRKMRIADKYAVVKVIAGYQKAWTATSFREFGSLYYSEDLGERVGNSPLYTNGDGIEIADEKFAIGQSTGREFNDHGRATIDFDRGPWKTSEHYHNAIGKREIACVEKLARLPKSPITLCGPGTYQPTKERKLQALDCYLKLIRYALPLDKSIASSHLWHSDLHEANIFVNPAKPTEIVGIIDWQSTEIAPLYFQAREPALINYDGPPVVGLERPFKPDNFEQLEPHAKKLAEALWLKQSLVSLYKNLTHQFNPQLYAAFEFQETTSFSLLLVARNILVDGEAAYLGMVAELENGWGTLPGAKGATYPFSFSETERKEIKANVEGSVRGMDVMRGIKDSIGDLFPEQGVVRAELYEEALDALDALEQMKEQVIAIYARNEQEREEWRREWPF